MINSEKSLLHRKTVITMCAVILLLVRRQHRHAMTFCAFEKVRETTLAEKGHWEQW
jgi:hypothetical protein